MYHRNEGEEGDLDLSERQQAFRPGRYVKVPRRHFTSSSPSTPPLPGAFSVQGTGAPPDSLTEDIEPDVSIEAENTPVVAELVDRERDVALAQQEMRERLREEVRSAIRQELQVETPIAVVVSDDMNADSGAPGHVITSLETRKRVSTWFIVLIVIVIVIVAVVAGVIAGGKNDSPEQSPIEDDLSGTTATDNQTTASPTTHSSEATNAPSLLETAIPTTKASTSPPTPQTTQPPVASPTVPPTPLPTATPFVDVVFTQVADDIFGKTSLEQFGKAIAVSSDGNQIAVAAPYNSEGLDEVGVVRVFRSAGDQWVNVGEPLSGTLAEDTFGKSIALSGDGTILVCGAPQVEPEGATGYVRAFWLTSSEQWEQIGDDMVGSLANDSFGEAVAISKDGSTIAVGADQFHGLARGYVQVFRREVLIPNWVQIGQVLTGTVGDHVGDSVALSEDGSIVAIGATQVLGDGPGFVDVYALDGNRWLQIGSRLVGKGSGDRFGSSVALSSDGIILAVGAYRYGQNPVAAGQVSVFGYQNTGWEQLGNDIIGHARRGYFGKQVALSSDGRTLVSASSGIGASTARAFRFVNNDWVMIGDRLSGQTTVDEFGASLALSDDGSLLAIGAPRNDAVDTDAGLVVVYEATERT